MSLRIAVWHDPPMGGAQRSFSEMLLHLSKRGHSIDVYRRGQPNEDATSESAYGIQVHLVPFAQRRHRRLASYWNDFQTLRDLKDEERLEEEMARTVDAAGYDVLLCSVLRDGTAPSLLRFSQTPTIYYCHEPPRRFYEPWCRPEAAPLSAIERGRLLWRWPTQRLLDRWSQKHDRLNVQSASLVLTNSLYTSQRVREVYQREAEVCYLGVDAYRFAPAPKTGARAGVVSIGRLEAHKGFDFLIEALGLLPESIRPPLTIVGSGGHPNMPLYLRKLALRRGVKLELHADLSDQALAELYQSSIAFVFGARLEPFGLVLLEAMACGLPVIAVAEGGIPEIVADGVTGFLTKRSATAFADRLAAVLRSPELREALGAAGREAAEQQWSWDGTVNTLESHLQRVAGFASAPQPAL